MQHVGVRPIVPPGGMSWKQPCSLTGAPPYDDDDDDDEFILSTLSLSSSSSSSLNICRAPITSRPQAPNSVEFVCAAHPSLCCNLLSYVSLCVVLWRHQKNKDNNGDDNDDKSNTTSAVRFLWLSRTPVFLQFLAASCRFVCCILRMWPRMTDAALYGALDTCRSQHVWPSCLHCCRSKQSGIRRLGICVIQLFGTTGFHVTGKRSYL